MHYSHYLNNSEEDVLIETLADQILSTVMDDPLVEIDAAVTATDNLKQENNEWKNSEFKDLKHKKIRKHYYDKKLDLEYWLNTFKYHMKRYRPFKCKMCEERFANNDHMRKHKQNHHTKCVARSNMNTADSSVTPDIDKFEAWDKKKPFKCKKCEKKI